MIFEPRKHSKSRNLEIFFDASNELENKISHTISTMENMMEYQILP